MYPSAHITFTALARIYIYAALRSRDLLQNIACINANRINFRMMKYVVVNQPTKNAFLFVNLQHCIIYDIDSYYIRP